MDEKVCAIIVTFNSEKYIGELVNSLKRQTHPVEIVVIDNGSIDGTVKIAEEAGAAIIKNADNLGFAAANNIGAQHARSIFSPDFLLLVNPDIIAHERMVEEMLKTFLSAPGSAVVQAKLFLMKERYLLNTAGNAIHFLYFSYCMGYRKKDYAFSDEEIPVASGACMMIKEKALKSIGKLFNDVFFLYNEDTDLCLRARIMGYNIVLSANAVGWHDYTFISGNNEKFFHMEKNRLFLALQNYRLITLVILSPAFLFTEAQVLLFSLMEGWLSYKIRSYFWLISNLKNIRQSRREVQGKRILKDRELMKLMTPNLNFEELKNPGIRLITNPALKLWRGIVICFLNLFNI